MSNDVDESENYFDLGDFSKKVSTISSKAQTWFDRGLTLIYGFNHEEAIICFEKAIQEDPNCPMFYWGIAYCHGINYNNSNLESENFVQSFQNAKKALELSKKGSSSFERALIEALQPRCPSPTQIDQTAMILQEKSFSEAMRKVYSQYPDDPDVSAIFAQSMMNLNPWKLWKDGEPTNNTLEIIDVLEKSLEKFPKHPGLLHLILHTFELSPFLEKVLPYCKALEDLVPDSGHLRHMPCHIYIQLGRYDEANACNQKGIIADSKYLKLRGNNNFYTLYRIHNYHFLLYSAMFQGQYKLAIQAAREITKNLPEEFLRTNRLTDWYEGFYPMYFHVLIRFGKWEEILKEKLPKDKKLFCYTHTIGHYARGLAYASMEKIEEAEKERQLFVESLNNLSPARHLLNNLCKDIAKLAQRILEGEIEYRKGNFQEAFRLLRLAVEMDDSLPYEEPWAWMEPARHALGALLLEQNQFDEAESVYRKDLELHPNNCWSLHGLAECLERKKLSQSNEIRSLLEKAQEKADIPLKASCYCRLGVLKKLN